MRTPLNKYVETLMEWIIKGCGYISAFIVLLIVLFLFKEGISFIDSSPIEKNYGLFTGKGNPVSQLTAVQIKDIFDQKIKTWEPLGGTKDPIITITVNDLEDHFTKEQLGPNYEYLSICVNHFLDSIPGSVAFFSERQLSLIGSTREIEIKSIGLWDFLSGREWFPTAHPASVMGTLPLLLGTLVVSFFAILFALPLGLAAAIYLAEIANHRVRNILKPIIELLSGIPSVVYGFFGLVIIVPMIQNVFHLPVGETALAGSILLAIMALPTIITVSEDAIRTTPQAMKEASFALGASHWQTIWKVILPNASSGITAAAILGIGRAIGETMAVLMVTGNAAIMPHSLVQPVRTIPATIAAELGEAAFGGLHFKSLFALACMLFLITLLTNLIVERITLKRKTS
ncbi:MAG: phosphate ABC transporter permease subunit PstC [Saprospiraceae bacterium]|jgi:phosphate transport system permease protein|nr:phosphate ABC transporter permease subunit PstC [Saprospiraceae bacterium]MBK8298016.1 phosphate ABC transporter permease subunit PstC [Saprospiraceae bacterium]